MFQLFGDNPGGRLYGNIMINFEARSQCLLNLEEKQATTLSLE